MSDAAVIRLARREDASTIHTFIHASANDQGEAKVDATLDRIVATHHFDGEESSASNVPTRFAWTLLAVAPEGEIAGLATYFYNYASWSGAPGLYLEELYVLPRYRARGYAMQLVEAMAREGKKVNCVKIEWVCLKANERALAFYKKTGAKVKDDWALLHVDQAGLVALADRKDV